jgi:LytR cell envelope-related transcriptional attenuator
VRWRTPITLCVLFVVLFGAAYYGWQTVVSPVTGSDSAPTTPGPTRHTPQKPTCAEKTTYPKGRLFRASSFRVNVYNASAVSGRAAEVLAALENNGFQGGVAANPPPSVTATNVSIVTLTPDAPRVQLLKQQFKGPVKLVPGPVLDAGFDVVIGPEFQGVVPDAPSQLTLTKATSVCVRFAVRTAAGG